MITGDAPTGSEVVGAYRLTNAVDVLAADPPADMEIIRADAVPLVIHPETREIQRFGEIDTDAIVLQLPMVKWMPAAIEDLHQRGIKVIVEVDDNYEALHDAELHMFPDAHETLDRLKDRGVKLALITNGAAVPQRAKVVRFALEHRFDHIQIEGEHGFGKPEEQAYRHAMQALGVGPKDTWMIGDNLEWEVVAPQRLGIYAIWYDGHGIGLPPNSPIRPDRIIRTLPELLP